MPHYRIRLALQPSPRDEMWKITQDGQDLEKKARDVQINVPVYTEEATEATPDRFGRYERWYVACDGQGRWQGLDYIIDSE